MVNMFNPKKKDENPPNEDGKQTLKTEAPPAQPTTQASDQPAVLLQKLKMEEAQLIEEREHLAQLKERLKKKINDQIENSKDNLQKLRTEVVSLKTECAEMNETLQYEVLA